MSDLDRLYRNLIIVAIVCLAAIAIIFLLAWLKYVSLSNFIYFFCGVLGGFVSIQQRLPKMKPEELQTLVASKYKIYMMPIYGGVFALLLYVAFISKMVEGSLMPKYTVPDPKEDTSYLYNIITGIHAESGVDFTKMIVWSFLAGFSERLVPSMLSKLDNSTNDLRVVEGAPKKTDEGVQPKPRKEKKLKK